ncbi:hypothetical protein BH23GEM3_BH23GEM3_27030 [soil metagenome]
MRDSQNASCGDPIRPADHKKHKRSRGTMIWSESIPVAIETIEQAPFLTEQQKRDIFYNNAARFLRLTPAEIARDHGQ